MFFSREKREKKSPREGDAGQSMVERSDVRIIFVIVIIIIGNMAHEEKLFPWISLAPTDNEEITKEGKRKELTHIRSSFLFSRARDMQRKKGLFISVVVIIHRRSQIPVTLKKVDAQGKMWVPFRSILASLTVKPAMTECLVSYCNNTSENKEKFRLRR